LVRVQGIEQHNIKERNFQTLECFVSQSTLKFGR
jgi:hypothetical protein